jgi:hypothetical protein
VSEADDVRFCASETAGSLHGGRQVWVLATLPGHIEVGGDPVRSYVLLMNSHGWLHTASFEGTR